MSRESDIRLTDYYFKTQSFCHFTDFFTHITKTDNSQSFSCKLGADIFSFVPKPIFKIIAGLRYMPEQGNYQSYGMFGCGSGVAERGINNGNFFPGCGK